MKVSELTKEDLDYWVAKAAKVEIYTGEAVCRVDTGEHWYPSLDWSCGGPIMESERIAVLHVGGANGYWQAGFEPEVDHGSQCDSGWLELPAIVLQHESTGPTPLIAAMRAYVASKFGETVPEEGK